MHPSIRSFYFFDRKKCVSACTSTGGLGRGLAFRSIDGRMTGQRDAPRNGTKSAV